MATINPCFGSLSKEEQEILKSKSEAHQKNGKNQHDADILAARELQDEAIGHLNNIYSDLGIEGYKNTKGKTVLSDTAKMDNAISRLNDLNDEFDNLDRDDPKRVELDKKRSELMSEIDKYQKIIDENKTEPKPVEPEEKKEPTRQERINDLVDMKQNYNSLRKNDPSKPEMLNKMRLEANELGLTLEHKQGVAELKTSGRKNVQKRFEGGKTEISNFDPSSYDPKTLKVVSDLAKNDAYLTGVNIVGGDGKTMSEKQKANALEDIRNGKNTIGSKALHDGLDEMVKNGLIEIKDPATGHRTGIPLDDFMKLHESNEEVSMEEVNTMIESTLTDEEFENFKNYIEYEQTGQGGMVQEPSPGKTEKGTEGSVSDKKTSGTGGKTPEAGRVQRLADSARKLADKIRNADITGSGGGAALSDISSIPRQVIASAIDGFASALEAGAKAVDALKQAIQFIKDNSDFEDDKKIEDYLRGQLAADVPELGEDFNQLDNKGRTVSADAPTPDLFDTKEPKTIKTGGGFKSTFVRNFERLASLEKRLGTDQEALKAAYKAASSAGTAKEALVKVAREMKNAFGDRANQVYTDMRKMLVQSNLNGVRDRWNDWSTHFRKADTEEIQKWATDPKYAEKNGLPELEFITDRMERDPHFRGMTRAANELIGRNNFDGLKDMMSINFNRAAQLVNNIDFTGGKSYEEMRKDPEIQKAKGIYYKELGSKIEAAHAQLGGAMREYLGEEGVYYPLNQITPEEGEQKRKWFQKRSPLAGASTPNNDLATGFSKNYDLSVASLQDRITSAYKAKDKNAMINTFKTEGYMVPFQNGARENVINIEGNYVPAVKMNINEGSNLRPAYYLVPEGVAQDIRGLIFDKSGKQSDGVIKKALENVTGFINKTTLSTPIEALRHTTNLLFRLNQNTSFAANNLAGKIVGRIPVIKQIMQLGHLSFMDPTAEKWQNTFREMGEAGEIPDKYAKSTFSQNWADMTGGEKASWWKANFSPLLYGTSGIDIRARMMMWDISKAMNPDATPDQMRKVMSGLGDYNKGLQSEVVKLLKEQGGLAPFIVSQQARIRAGIQSFNILPQYSSLPLEGLPLSQQLFNHTMNLLQSSVYGYLGMWATAYLASTGKAPWNDPGARLGVIPIQHDDGTVTEINLGAMYSAASIGTKVTGMDAFANAKMQGKDNDEALEKGFLQAFNTDLAPVGSGSPVMHVASGLFGVAPYIVSLNDDRGQPSINFLPTTIPAEHKGDQMGYNVLNDVIHTNPLVGAATDLTMRKTLGFDLQRDQKKEWWKQDFFQNMLEGIFPGLFAVDVDLKQQEYYQKRDEDVQQRAFKRETDKQQKENE